MVKHVLRWNEFLVRKLLSCECHSLENFARFPSQSRPNSRQKYHYNFGTPYLCETVEFIHYLFSCLCKTFLPFSQESSTEVQINILSWYIKGWSSYFARMYF